MDTGFQAVAERARTREQVEADYQKTLTRHEKENRRLVASAEDVLFRAVQLKNMNMPYFAPHPPAALREMAAATIPPMGVRLTETFRSHEIAI